MIIPKGNWKVSNKYDSGKLKDKIYFKNRVNLFLTVIFYKFRLKFVTCSSKSFKDDETHMLLLTQTHINIIFATCGFHHTVKIKIIS